MLTEPVAALSAAAKMAEKADKAEIGDAVLRALRPTSDNPPVAIFMDGFEYHRDRTHQDSLQRMALVRAGFRIWSLTWKDLDAAFGDQRAVASVLPDRGEMAGVQVSLDDTWDTNAIRGWLRAGEPSLTLLLRYLAEPDGEVWRRATFTHLLGSFRRDEMQSREFRERFTKAAQALPGAAAESRRCNDAEFLAEWQP